MRLSDVNGYETHQQGKMNFLNSGAGEESRTLDLNLGKVALYQLSYSRVQNNDYDRTLTFFQDRFTALQSLEREKSLELSTSTLARLRSTN